MPVGNVDSIERGSGARFNDGKPDLSLIPAGYLRNKGGEHLNLLTSLSKLQLDGDFSNLMIWYKHQLHQPGVQEAIAHVFTYGRAKYAAHNWMKGMAWSIPLACALRHADALWYQREENDPESNLPHIGHIMCNLIMLMHYNFAFPEGNDLPFRVLGNSDARS